MTSSPSRLSSEHEVLVVDAGVMINLLGTGSCADLLRTLNRKILMDEFAWKEVTTDPFSKTSGQKAMQTLLESALVEQVQLSNSAFEMFLNLTGATPPDDLGDGEAATIAQAIDTGAIPVIDERKATRIALSIEPKRPVLHTIDVLGCSAVTNALPARELADLIYGALIHARMWVPATCRERTAASQGPTRRNALCGVAPCAAAWLLRRWLWSWRNRKPPKDRDRGGHLGPDEKNAGIQINKRPKYPAHSPVATRRFG